MLIINSNNNNNLKLQLLDHDTDLNKELPRTFVPKMKNDATLPIKVPKVRQFKCDYILHLMLGLQFIELLSERSRAE